MADKLERIFLYGTLRNPPLLNLVAGGPVSGVAAILRDHEIRAADGQTFPLIRVAPGETVPGIVVSVPKEMMQRIDFYEIGFGYQLVPIEIEVAGKPEAALVYLPEPDRWRPGRPWSLDKWTASHGDLALEAASDYMELFGKMTPEAAALRYPQILMRAASRMRANRTPRPTNLGLPPRRTAIDVDESRTPYVGYFAVREDYLRFPRFDGGKTPYVTRAAFMGGDAVTVVPYDPKRDACLVVRQFRFGAYARGDRQPWCVEPIAGRIDPGETPEEAARREAEEEAGLMLGQLYPVARYYPSPAAYSEFIYSFVAPCDLSGVDGRVSGVEGETEDIQSRVVAMSELMDMVATGEADTGPLVLSAFWLQGNKRKLRGRG